MASFLTALFVFASLSSQSAVNGFTLELIHPHSPENPFRYLSESRFGWIREAYNHTLTRAARFAKFASDLKQAGGSYAMKYSVGTPPFETYGIADTGSVITWTQCRPCDDCFPQESPVFNPKNSKSYRVATCDSDECALFSSPYPFPTCSDDNTCQYTVSYGDKSKTVGDLAIDTLTFGGASFKNIVFGCGHQNNGTFSNETSGIVGLGRSDISIINQLDKEIEGKFAYCLGGDQDSKSHISFGAKAAVGGPGAVKTQMFESENQPEFYWLYLEGVSVGGKKAFPGAKKTTLPPAGPPSKGNIIIDSGTTLTMIRTDMFESLVTELKGSIDATPVDDPAGVFGLCYATSDAVRVPDIVAHFAGGADVKLSPKGTFLEVEEGVTCLTIIPDTNVGISIFGNLSEIDYLVGYDLEEETVSFKPADCSKF
ncbi:unnamed protein product [Cuscuta campestris]|uniref:Peptidase A1 domain-containing protein n=1 Tax=Cuscuta campestris TaxID=132261 RepID=A0A484NUL0_9ASTE|nr:unnamed protein product [Cuscuta campestris]